MHIVESKNKTLMCSVKFILFRCPNDGTYWIWHLNKCAVSSCYDQGGYYECSLHGGVYDSSGRYISKCYQYTCTYDFYQII